MFGGFFSGFSRIFQDFQIHSRIFHVIFLVFFPVFLFELVQDVLGLADVPCFESLFLADQQHLFQIFCDGSRNSAKNTR